VDIENLAVSKIGAALSGCPHLKAYLSTNDKTPFTDGHIDLYSSLAQTNENWRGRVSVQVKGRTRSAKPRATMQFQVSRVDLAAFQRDSGVLYFVVAVNPDSLKCSPYFAILSPSKIEWLLAKAPPERQAISISMKAFPDDPQRIEPLISLALKTRDQNASLGFDPVLFDRMSSITIHTAEVLDFTHPVTLSPEANDFALVINTSEGMAVPVGGALRIFPPEYTEHELDVRVESAAVGFDSVTVKRKSETIVEVRVADGLSIEFEDDGDDRSGKVRLSLRGSLRNRIKTAEFYLALVETSTLAIAGEKSKFIVDTNSDLSNLRGLLRQLHILSELAEVLGMDDAIIDVDEIDDAELRQLILIHGALVAGREIKDSSLKVSRAIQAFAEWNIMFLVMPGSGPDSWRLVDPFDPATRQQFSWHADGTSSKQRIRVTSFDVLDQESLPSIANLRLDTVVSAYEELAELPDTGMLANTRVLAFIAAADSLEDRRSEFLTAANDLNEWLIKFQGESHIHLINRWQIAARRGGLPAKQQADIRSLAHQAIRKEVADPEIVETVCAVLLGDEQWAEEANARMSKAQIEKSKSWPIWTLRRR
jgi:hypothetical protein